MRNVLQKQQGSVADAGRANGFIPSSLRTLSGYLRIVSSGASTVASTVRSAASVASAIVYKEDDLRHDQVLWAGFDKLEFEGGALRQILLLGLRSGFQVWDVEEANNVHELVSRQDGLVHFMQMLRSPLSGTSEDKFASYRPLLVVCAHGCVSHGSNVQDGVKSSCSGGTSNGHYSGNGCLGPFFVRVYSLTSPAFVHVLKFRSVVYAVRCSSRIVAVCQSAQIHCLNASTLEREYTILTNPIVMTPPGSGSVGYGPLAVGPRWLAYSGSAVAVSDTCCVTPQHLTHSATFPNRSPNGSRVALYAKESSKQLAAGIVTLRDIGYKRLSRYCSELLPDSNHSYPEAGGWKANGVTNGHVMDMDNAGMVIVRDIVSKSVVAQFRAHKSPISALCFDPSGTLLVTASVQGHNINIFKIMTGFSYSTASESGGSYAHLYRLQRGFTNAVIQDISFSNDSHWIMIGTSRGTSHLFAISPSGGAVNSQSADDCLKMNGTSDNTYIHRPSSSDDQTLNQRTMCTAGLPVTLSAVSRIRSGDCGWRDTVTGAAAAATGKISSLSGVTASSFHHCKVKDMHACSLKAKCHLLVFSPSGSLIQYALRIPKGPEFMVDTGSGLYEQDIGVDSKIVVEPVKKWNICQKRSRENDDLDIYGENGSLDYSNVVYDRSTKTNGVYLLGQCAIARAKKSSEEKHHFYISEAELQLQQNKVPFWANSQIYFQRMIICGIKVDGESAVGGEMEIERILTQPIEVRPKHVAPAFAHLLYCKSENTRTGSQHVNLGPKHAFGMSQVEDIPSQIRSPFSNSTEHGACIRCFLDDTGETIYSNTKDTLEGPVNNDDSPGMSCKLDPVNNSDRERLKVEAQHKVVNNSNESMTTGNLFDDQCDEFD